MPNWGNDVTIEEKEGVYNISAKTTDSFCGKVSAQLTEDQVKELQILLAELDNHKVPEDAILVADGGVRQITVKNLNQDAVTIQLNQMFESQDGLYAANGDSLAACIEALDQSLMMYCQ